MIQVAGTLFVSLYKLMLLFVMFQDNDCDKFTEICKPFTVS